MSVVNFTVETYPDAVRAVIEQRLMTEWDSATPISWPLLPYTPITNAAWLKLDILHGQSREMTLGVDTALNLNVGSIQLQIYAPKGEGAGAQLNALTGRARKIFSRYFGNGLRCGASSLKPQMFDNSWLVATITTPFDAYETQN